MTFVKHFLALSFPLLISAPLFGASRLCSLSSEAAFSAEAPQTIERIKTGHASLDQAIAEVQDATGGSRAEVAELISRFLKAEVLKQVKIENAAKRAFSKNPQGVIETSKFRMVSQDGQWFVEQKDGSISSVPLDHQMGLPDGRSDLVRSLLRDLTEHFTKQGGVESGEIPVFVTADFNGLKLVNEAVPTPSFPRGHHGTGDVILAMSGRMIADSGTKGFFARVGGDEIMGVIFVKSAEEARNFGLLLNERLAQATEAYLREQKDQFQGTQAHLFRLDKDRPSFSLGVVALNDSFSQKAIERNISPYDLASAMTDASMTRSKAEYKKANGLPISRDGVLDFTKLGQNWIPPTPTVFIF